MNPGPGLGDAPTRAATRDDGRRHRHHRPGQRDQRRGQRVGESGDLALMQFNCNGVWPRLTELRARLASERPHLVLLQETKLRAGQEAPTFPGYNAAARQDWTPPQTRGRLQTAQSPRNLHLRHRRHHHLRHRKTRQKRSRQRKPRQPREAPPAQERWPPSAVSSPGTREPARNGWTLHREGGCREPVGQPSRTVPGGAGGAGAIGAATSADQLQRRRP